MKTRGKSVQSNSFFSGNSVNVKVIPQCLSIQVIPRVIPQWLLSSSLQWFEMQMSSSFFLYYFNTFCNNNQHIWPGIEFDHKWILNKLQTSNSIKHSIHLCIFALHLYNVLVHSDKFIILTKQLVIYPKHLGRPLLSIIQ